MAISVLIVSLGSLPYFALSTNTNTRWLVYLLSSIQGVGLAIMINSATSLISDVIGKNAESSAFVYGIYSFFDKIANGLIIFGITSVWVENAPALKACMAFIPPICSVGAFILAWIGQRAYEHRLAKFSNAGSSQF